MTIGNPYAASGESALRQPGTRSGVATNPRPTAGRVHSAPGEMNRSVRTRHRQARSRNARPARMRPISSIAISGFVRATWRQERCPKPPLRQNDEADHSRFHLYAMPSAERSYDLLILSDLLCRPGTSSAASCAASALRNGLNQPSRSSSHSASVASPFDSWLPMNHAFCAGGIPKIANCQSSASSPFHTPGRGSLCGSQAAMRRGFISRHDEPCVPSSPIKSSA